MRVKIGQFESENDHDHCGIAHYRDLHKVMCGGNQFVSRHPLNEQNPLATNYRCP